jgi:hypothetical protein
MHAIQNNGKKDNKMSATNPVLSQIPFRPHRAPDSHGTAGKQKDRTIVRFIRVSNMISRTGLHAGVKCAGLRFHFCAMGQFAKEFNNNSAEENLALPRGIEPLFQP